MEEEIWAPVKGFEGRYEVSTLGRVRSLSYNGTGLVKVLKPSGDTHGYTKFSLCKDGRRYMKKTHRLVAEAFLEKPKNKECVDHINGIRSDNACENLRWCSHKENLNYPLFKLKAAVAKIGMINELCHNSRRLIQKTMDGTVIKEWPSAMEVQRTLGFGQPSITNCCNGKKQSAYGYKWEWIDAPKRKPYNKSNSEQKS